jgi:hypothetical protein
MVVFVQPANSDAAKGENGGLARSMIMLASVLDLSKLSSPTLLTRRRASAVALNAIQEARREQGSGEVSL